jgi:uncharacterized protein
MEEPSGQEPQGVNDLWFADGEMRAVWKVSVYGVITFFMLFFTGGVVYVFLPFLDWRFSTPLLTGGAALTATLICSRLIDRRDLLGMIGLRWHRGAWRQLGMGMALTLGMIILLVGLELALGEARMLSGHVTTAHTLSLLFLGLLSFTLVGFAEEILVRGYPFTVLRNHGGVVTALLLTSGVFSLIHAFNPGIGWFGFLNIFLAGIWLGLARVVSGSLWLPVGLHIGWNFFMGPVFGFPVSGIIERSVLVTRTGGPEWISGGAFGPEAGLLATLVLIAGTAVLYQSRIRALLSEDGSREDGSREDGSREDGSREDGN